MSIHPSLGAAVKGKQQKSVLKRTERMKYLMKKGLWTHDSKVFGLPKIKAVRIKIKKEKAAEKPVQEGVVEAQAESTTSSVSVPAEQKTKATPKK